MSNPTDGGPAFPRTAHERYYDDCGHGPQDGMSLRDWFAGQALQGWLANGQGKIHTGSAKGAFGSLPAWCYEMADEMLKAREATREQ